LDINNGQLTGVGNIAGQANTSGYSIWGGLDFANSAYMSLYGSAHPSVASVISFGTSSAERMRITAAGNVGIGTGSPNTRLQVAGGVVRIEGSGGEGGHLELLNVANSAVQAIFDVDGSDVTRILVLPSGNLTFGTNATERMRIDASGNAGFGTSSPRGRIDIAGGALAGVGNMHGNSNSGGFTIWGGESSLNGGYIQFLGGSFAGAPSTLVFGSNSSEKMRLTSGGSLGIGTANPASAFQVAGAGRFGADPSSTEGTVGIYNSGNNGVIEVFAGNASATKRNLLLTRFGGNVAIGGTDSPASSLHVVGDLTMSSATTTAGAGAVVGYLVVSINGTSRKIPIHAT
jgi:uncharacterized protein YaiE (UPF0345 family)